MPCKTNNAVLCTQSRGVNSMLFDKNIEPSCSYCLKGRRISNFDVVCEKRGIVPSSGSCSHFSYDPLKREPAKPAVLKTGEFSEEDFKL